MQGSCVEGIVMNICIFTRRCFFVFLLLALGLAMASFAFMNDEASPALKGEWGPPDPNCRMRLWSLPELIERLCSEDKKAIDRCASNVILCYAFLLQLCWLRMIGLVVVYTLELYEYALELYEFNY